MFYVNEKSIVMLGKCDNHAMDLCIVHFQLLNTFVGDFSSFIMNISSNSSSNISDKNDLKYGSWQVRG